MKGLSQVLGLTFVYKYSQLKPKTWLRPFVNTAPGISFVENYVMLKVWLHFENRLKYIHASLIGMKYK